MMIRGEVNRFRSNGLNEVTIKYGNKRAPQYYVLSYQSQKLSYQFPRSDTSVNVRYECVTQCVIIMFHLFNRGSSFYCYF